MDALDQRRLGQVQLVEAALVGDAAGVELGAHRAVAEEHAALEPLEEGTSHGVRILPERVESRDSYKFASYSTPNSHSKLATRGRGTPRRPSRV